MSVKSFLMNRPVVKLFRKPNKSYVSSSTGSPNSEETKEEKQHNQIEDVKTKTTETRRVPNGRLTVDGVPMIRRLRKDGGRA